MKDKTIRVGVIGAGRWGPNVIGGLNRIPATRVSLVADREEQALQALEQRFPQLSTTQDTNEIFDDDTIDAVAVCTPVGTHLDFVEQAIAKSKHVFVEKPFGKNPERCGQLAEEARREELVILVGHIFLFNSTILSLKKIVDSGQLGKVQHMEAHRTNLGPVRKDVNATWDLTSHDLSIFDFILGSLPEAVSCLGSRHLDPEIEDTSYTTFRYPGSVIAHAHASWLNPRKVRQITVIGSQKMVLWDDLSLDRPITIFDSSIGLDQSYYSDSFASHRLSYNQGDVILPSTPRNEPLYAELQHFINLIHGRDIDIPYPDGFYGTEVARTLKAADNSLLSDGAFVSVDRSSV